MHVIYKQIVFLLKQKKKSINLANESWDTHLTTIEKDREVVETMAKFLSRTIVIYSLSCSNEIREKFVNNEDRVNGPPLLLAKEKLYYQSLKRGDVNVEVKVKPTILKRPAPAAVTHQPSPEKKPKKDETKKNDAATEDKISKSVPTIDEGNRRESKVKFVSNQRMDDLAQITGGANPSNDDNTFSSKVRLKRKFTCLQMKIFVHQKVRLNR
ncbi:unnamed protein product [Mytilus edulis]|uniref:Uncharacterized protein n=1 Tax=Mytilus edulis TaxID=6550 RepID=A0A8S3RKG9_MYTED|nr:unnamed protein product [Mytilus edulis]